MLLQLLLFTATLMASDFNSECVKAFRSLSKKQQLENIAIYSDMIRVTEELKKQNREEREEWKDTKTVLTSIHHRYQKLLSLGITAYTETEKDQDEPNFTLMATKVTTSRKRFEAVLPLTNYDVMPLWWERSTALGKTTGYSFPLYVVPASSGNVVGAFPNMKNAQMYGVKYLVVTVPVRADKPLDLEAYSAKRSAHYVKELYTGK